MSRAGRSLLVFGVYVLAVGIGLLAAPNLLLGTMGLSATEEPWIRSVGVLLSLLGFYYIQAGRAGLTEFIRLSVYGRAAVPVLYLALIALGLVPVAVLSFGAADLLGAVWTARALRSEAVPRSP